jgi:hypothetical protein
LPCCNTLRVNESEALSPYGSVTVTSIVYAPSQKSAVILHPSEFSLNPLSPEKAYSRSSPSPSLAAPHASNSTSLHPHGTPS